jgi:hypothetical protein
MAKAKKKPFATIDLNLSREKRTEELVNCIEQYTNDNKIPKDQVIQMILDDVLGHELVDDELEESLIISIARSFGCKTKNPQCELNDGFEGNDDEDAEEPEEEEDDPGPPSPLNPRNPR